jgi:hypothetical protein
MPYPNVTLINKKLLATDTFNPHVYSPQSMKASAVLLKSTASMIGFDKGLTFIWYIASYK